MTDEYTQPDCPAQSDEAKPKGWPNELEAALLALAVLFFGMWGYRQFFQLSASQVFWEQRPYEVIPIALLLVLVLLMQRRFRFDLLSRLSARKVVFVLMGVCAALLIGQVVFHGKPVLIAMLWSILWVGVAAPIVEELFFRGVLLKALLRHSDEAWAVLIATLAFAFVHPPDNPVVFFRRLFLGALLGALAVRTRSVIPAIFGHIAWNLYLMFELPGIGGDAGFTTTTALGVAIILGISVTIGLLTYLNRKAAE